MANWSDTGHGMRRRMGAPSNHLESAGNNMARTHMTHEEALEHPASAQSARLPMGMDAYSVTAPQSYAGTLVPKHDVQSNDPVGYDHANRANIERVGATYRVNAAMGPQIDPSAGPTMANARIVPSIQGRENPNFELGIQSTY
jgi:hypothetical protein